MFNQKFKSTKLEMCCHLIPTFMFIFATSSVILTMFFMFVLQSGYVYPANDEKFFDGIRNTDFKEDAVDGTLDDDVETPSTQPFQTFMFKETINPGTNNHIKTNNNLRNMKAYKIVSKEPIMENSLVKIVMAPQHFLEKLSKENVNLKYSSKKIDETAIGPIKTYNDADAFGRELIRIGNKKGNLNDFSNEKQENIDLKYVEPMEGNGVHSKSNNIQVIANSRNLHLKRKGPEAVVSNIDNLTHDKSDLSREINGLKSVELSNVEMEHEQDIAGSEVRIDETTPQITTATQIEELLSNPTVSNRGDISINTNSLENVSVDADSSSYQININNSESSSTDTSQIIHTTPNDISTDMPLVVLKILKNHTVFVEETNLQSMSDEISEDTIVIPKCSPSDDVPVRQQVTRPVSMRRPETRHSTTTLTPSIDTNTRKFPKKASILNCYKSPLKLDDSISIEQTPKIRLLEMETTNSPPHFEQYNSKGKSKNTKRAIGDEGTFNNIVRPRPLRPKNFGDLLKNETSAERAERLNKSLQRLMHFITIVGHVDSYMTKRFRSGLKSIARMLDSAEHTRRRRSNALC